MRNRFPSLFAFALVFASGARADVVEYFANAEEGRRLELGNGRDGAFADGPAQAGITVVGAAISIDTSVKSVFEFSTFALTAGHTLTATGSAPLVIRVRGAAIVAGAIHLDGGDGDPAIAASAGAGGNGGSGGGSGGRGGVQPPSPVDGANGEPRAGNSIGGGGGPNDPALSGQREGGGGCNGPGATGGALYPASAATCPLGAPQIADRFELAYFTPDAGTLPGGAGGGGGGTRSLNAANAMNGAGGGGGGGALVFSAGGDLVLSGSVTANGGNGGDGALGTSDFGSSGGGGSGGSLWFQSAARISGAGALAVSGGIGGQDGSVTNVGGNGSRGVIRIDAATAAFTGTFTPAGAADRAFTVFPVTVEFGLSAGPACGTFGGPDAPRDFLANVALGLLLIGIGAARRAPSRKVRRR